MNKTILCFDVLNLLHRCFFIITAGVTIREDDDYDDGMFGSKSMTPTQIIGASITHTFNSMQKYYDKYNPDTVVCAFDNGSSWRKEYTKSDLCISGKLYKGNRRNNLTPAQKRMYDIFFVFADEFEQLLSEHSHIVCLSHKGLEADDLIAELCAQRDEEIIVVSTDKDLLQLLKYDHVKIIDPIKGIEQTLDKWDSDADYFIFEKCFRGDPGDNVQSAYPKIRSTKIKQAFTDTYLFETLMNDTFKDHRDVTLRVGDLFEENILLMNLDKQPDYIKQQMNDVVINSFEKTGKFNLLKFTKFIGKYKVKNLGNNLTSYKFLLA